MVSKTLALIAAASLAQEAVALNGHGHAHYHQKKDLFTEWETTTQWVTVTVPWEASTPHTSVLSTSSSTSTIPTSTPSPSTISTATPSTSSTPLPTPTTLSTSVAPTTLVTTTSAQGGLLGALGAIPSVVASVADHLLQPDSSSSSSSAAATSTSSSSSGSCLRGAAYNDGSLVNLFKGSKLAWTYNWGQTPDSADTTGLGFVPMLWGTADDHVSTWSTNAQKMISSGSSALISFNEPDNAGQANLAAAAAASAHQIHMNPFKGQARIGSPCITNSVNAGEGINWITEFLSACNGNCALDFVCAHWYNPADSTEFLSHLEDIHKATSLPVWVTEFQPLGASDSEVTSFLQEVFHQLETNSSYSFVERVAYFMVSQGNLVDSAGSSLSSFGQTYANY